MTTNIVKTIDNAKKRIADMPHAKKKLNPLWALLTEPLFQIIAAVGLLLSGVLGLVGKLLNGLGLGGLVNGLLGGLGVSKLLGGLGLGSITESLGLGGGRRSKLPNQATNPSSAKGTSVADAMLKEMSAQWRNTAMSETVLELGWVFLLCKSFFLRDALYHIN